MAKTEGKRWNDIDLNKPDEVKKYYDEKLKKSKPKKA